MAGLCITKDVADKFTKSVTDGKINPNKMKFMTSKERAVLLEEILGKEVGEQANLLFERKLLLKNTQKGLDNWVKQLSTEKVSKKYRKDILDFVNKLDEKYTPDAIGDYLNTLVNKRLGFEPTAHEIDTITKSALRITELKNKFTKDTKSTDDVYIEYGLESYRFSEYMRFLKKEHVSIPEWLSSPEMMIEDIGGTMKSVNSSIDNGYFGNQGIKTIFRFPKIFAKNFKNSIGDIVNEIKGKNIDGLKYIDVDGNVVTPELSFARANARAEAFSRALKQEGRYEAMGSELSLRHEEFFPSETVEKIPLLGRLFSASASAYENAAIRMRLDINDFMIDLAEKQGLDMKNPADAAPIGQQINSWTGRGKFTGKLAGLEQLGPTTNVLLYSIKFLKSNIDALMALPKAGKMEIGLAVKRSGLFESDRIGNYTKGEIFARRQAANTITHMIGGLAILYTIANTMNPGSVELDPRSSKFGQIKMKNGNYWNVTGGIGSLAVLAARLIPTPYKTKKGWDWAGWKKDSKGKYVKLYDIGKTKEGNMGSFNIGGYKPETGSDIFTTYFGNKASPLAGAASDFISGQMYSGEPVTIENVVKERVAPINIQTWSDLLKQENADNLADYLASTLGINVTVFQGKK